MNKGKLSKYFKAAAAKKLKAVDIDPSRSNQHEFTAVSSLREMLGTERREGIPSQFIFIDDDETGLTEDIRLTWYDTRENQKNRSPEWRLYYGRNNIVPLMEVGDTVFVLQRHDDELLLVFVKSGSIIENKMSWLFDVAIQDERRLLIIPPGRYDEREVDFVVRYILDEIGVETEEEDIPFLDSILEPLEGQFPNTKEFSKLARTALPEKVSSIEEPDTTLVKWFDFEDKLFRRMERRLISEILERGFVSANQEIDVDGFIKTSLSIHNRRKSRAGYAFEHHLEQVFIDNGLSYVRTPTIDEKVKPDFLFPSVEAYNNAGFPEKMLRILGAKTTAKDRWRQILSEGKRVPFKHFITLEGSISENQTDEMKANNLQLVVPRPLFDTYNQEQCNWLVSFGDFVQEIKGLYG